MRVFNRANGGFREMREILKKDLESIRELTSRIFSMEETGDVNRLGGMTNHTYAVEIKDKKFLYRQKTIMYSVVSSRAR